MNPLRHDINPEWLLEQKDRYLELQAKEARGEREGLRLRLDMQAKTVEALKAETIKAQRQRREADERLAWLALEERNAVIQFLNREGFGSVARRISKLHHLTPAKKTR